MKKIILTLLLFISPKTFAGMAEIGLSASYHNSKINETNYTVKDSITASISYYFWSMSPLELSYTSGRYESATGDPADSNNTIIIGISEFVGLDFVLSFASRESLFQPFIKVGGVYMDKEYYLDPDDDIKQMIDYQIGVAPSAGLGFRMKFSQAFSFKFTVDAWSTPINDERHTKNYDYAAKTGISWMF